MPFRSSAVSCVQYVNSDNRRGLRSALFSGFSRFHSWRKNMKKVLGKFVVFALGIITFGVPAVRAQIVTELDFKMTQ